MSRDEDQTLAPLAEDYAEDFMDRVSPHLGWLRAHIGSFERNAQLADELHQRVCYIAIKKIDELRDHENVRGWLRRTARNLHMRDYKKRANTRAREEGYGAERLRQPLPSVEHQLSQHEAVDAALTRLPPKHQSVFYLHVIEGYSFDEIGEQLDIPKNTARSRYMNARKTLRRRLAVKALVLWLIPSAARAADYRAAEEALAFLLPDAPPLPRPPHRNVIARHVVGALGVFIAIFLSSPLSDAQSSFLNRLPLLQATGESPPDQPPPSSTSPDGPASTAPPPAAPHGDDASQRVPPSEATSASPPSTSLRTATEPPASPSTAPPNLNSPELWQPTARPTGEPPPAFNRSTASSQALSDFVPPSGSQSSLIVNQRERSLPSPTERPPTPDVLSPDEAQVSILVVPENIEPTCELLSPEDGAAFGVGDGVSFEAAADDEDGDTNDLSASWSSDKDGTLTPTALSVPSDGSIFFTTDELSADSHTITLTVTDSRDGDYTCATTVYIGERPTIDLQQPTSGGEYAEGADVTFWAVAMDEDDSETELSIEWMLNGTWYSNQGINRSAESAAVIVDSSLPPGNHTVVVTVTDPLGLTATDSASFSIDECGDGVISSEEECDNTNLDGETCGSLGYDSGTLACTDTCTFDVLGCSSCGDGALDSGEACEPGITPTETCTDLGFEYGAVACDSACALDTSDCNSCGDGVVYAGSEECEDGVAITTTCIDLGFDGGDLACDSTCGFDTTSCFGCGNGVVEDDEACDGDDFAGGDDDCTDYDGFTDGEVTCNSDCEVILDDCTECGDGVADGDEACDGADYAAGSDCTDYGFDGGTLDCNSDCTLDELECTGCGNGELEADEECDGEALNGQDCEDLGYDGGELGCYSCIYDVSECHVCGDGVVDGDEECDDTDLGDAGDCEDVDSDFHGGTLDCTDDCEYDVEECEYCGDGETNGDEECDDDDYLDNDDACTDYEDFDDGEIACSDDCEVILDDCTECGDGDAKGDEECDGSDFADGDECSEHGFDGGDLDCNSDCEVETDECWECGDGEVNDDEECDGSDLDGEDCESVDSDNHGGDLDCSSSCDFDTSDCEYCGDGEVNGDEECDGNDYAGNNDACRDYGDFTGGDIDCNSDCTVDLSECTECGDNNIEAGEECDGSDLDGESCESFGYDLGDLDCDNDCEFDVSECELCTIEVEPAGDDWTDSFTPVTDCDLAPDCSSSDCGELYIGQVTDIDVGDNEANMQFTKADGSGGPSTSVSYWVVVGEPYPTCDDLHAYTTRKSGTWSSGSSTLSVSSVDIWPSVADFEAASDGDTKELFIITGGASDTGERLYYQRDAFIFTKVCE